MNLMKSCYFLRQIQLKVSYFLLLTAFNLYSIFILFQWPKKVTGFNFFSGQMISFIMSNQSNSLSNHFL